MHCAEGERWEAVAAVTRYAIGQYQLTRVFALPFARNDASRRVLEKCGYTLEGRLRRAVIKNGVIEDVLQYAFIAEPTITAPAATVP